MISTEEFEYLLTNNESTVLDYKEDWYDFANDGGSKATAKFVKDIISFANTIRQETAFIVFGIAQKPNGEIELKGLTKNIDDAILQDKIKDKVIPRPIFSSYQIIYKNKSYAVIEIPVRKYEMPIMPCINGLKGLQTGKVYYRNGSSNTEAKTIDIIRINDWFRSLPELSAKNTFQDAVSKYLFKLTNKDVKLSTIFCELADFARSYDLNELKQLCLSEISGIDVSKEKDNFYNYRIQRIIISPVKVEINSYMPFNTQDLKNEMENRQDFFDFKILFNQPIVKLESLFGELMAGDKSKIATMTTNSKELLGMPNNYPIYVYIFPKNFISLYDNIRQKTIDVLMRL